VSADDLRQPPNPVRVLAALSPLALLATLAVFAVTEGRCQCGAAPEPSPSPTAEPREPDGRGDARDAGAAAPLAGLLATGQDEAFGPAPRPGTDLADVRALISALDPLHRPFGAVAPGDWIESHPEPGQSFAEWRAAFPRTALGQRHVVYIQPLGGFTRAETRVVELTAALEGIAFGLPVEVLPALPIDGFPARARRVHPVWGGEQLLTSYILEEILVPRLPDDAAVLLAFTAADLWPGEGWNFVFGQATLRDRVGVWSIARNGRLDGSDEEVRTVLRRTFKTAVHETGHMFTMEHCTAYDCGMCGVNSLEEADRRPIWFCPECEAKILRATGVDPVWRFGALSCFFRRLGMEAEAAHYARSEAAALKALGRARGQGTRTGAPQAGRAGPTPTRR
jgi:archaemetzincin